MPYLSAFNRQDDRSAEAVPRDWVTPAGPFNQMAWRGVPRHALPGRNAVSRETHLRDAKAVPGGGGAGDFGGFWQDCPGRRVNSEFFTNSGAFLTILRQPQRPMPLAISEPQRALQPCG